MSNATELELNGGLEEFKYQTPSNEFHWGNYAHWLINHNQKHGNHGE